MSSRMPAEWMEHEGTIVEWPVRKSMIHPENYEAVCSVYKNIIETIASFEKVYVILNPSDKVVFSDELLNNIKPVMIPHNDAWVRDNGPTFVYGPGGIRKGIDWKFNAWGEKYTPYDLDNAVASEFIHRLGVDGLTVDMVLEGGSIHVDGQGTLLSTKECLLNPNRNPDMSQREIEDHLRDILGVDTFIWLENGLYGDETDGHIDNIACFGDEARIFIQTCRDEEDPNYSITSQALRVLEKAKDSKGRRIKVIELPNPQAHYYEEERLTLSYLNFYFVNGGILLPVFGGIHEETDAQAKKILEEAFPERSIVPIETIDLIKEGGNIHCITQQIPAERLIL